MFSLNCISQYLTNYCTYLESIQITKVLAHKRMCQSKYFSKISKLQGSISRNAEYTRTLNHRNNPNNKVVIQSQNRTVFGQATRGHVNHIWWVLISFISYFDRDKLSLVSRKQSQLSRLDSLLHRVFATDRATATTSSKSQRFFWVNFSSVYVSMAIFLLESSRVTAPPS